MAVASPVSVEVEELFCSVVVELSLGVVDEEASAGVESEANNTKRGAKLRFRSLHGGDIDDTHDACGFLE